ncbi:DUF262 domain-containing protein [Streptomyces sp. NPDC047023]|uniref:DUF262 domain-containing protein n=1 Tax=Streptomyces sp. NPDC047023 TaxID=3155139 RepID=UPI0033FD4BEF
MAGKSTRFQRSTNTQAASWFLDQLSAGRLNLDPPYQRRSVWNPTYKQFFIDSVIRNYPAPTIFLQVDVSTDLSQQTKYNVIDGKQRLTALFEFVKDEYPTPDTLEDLGLAGTYYSDLPQSVKVSLLEYVFTVESLKNPSTAELTQAFDRLNRNVARLNAQELRHAKYGGEFITKVEELADHPFWSEIGLATPTRIRRMLDVEYVSEFYIVAMTGIQDGKEYLDRYYADNDSEISDMEATNQRFIAAQDFLREVSKIYPLKGTRFANVADFYSLWAAIVALHSQGLLPTATAAAERLQCFAEELGAQETENAKKYHLAAIQGSNKGANRTVRAEALTSVLTAE